MLPEAIKRFEERREILEYYFKQGHPDHYSDIVKKLIEVITDEDGDFSPDPERITTIDHGDYQGDLLFIIARTGYQPSEYWSMNCSYGSCSGCDALEAIRCYSDDIPTDEQVKDYMTLALHLVQSMKKIK